MAQLASALRSGRRGRVFESPLPDINGWITHPTVFSYMQRFSGTCLLHLFGVYAGKRYAAAMLAQPRDVPHNTGRCPDPPLRLCYHTRPTLLSLRYRLMPITTTLHPRQHKQVPRPHPLLCSASYLCLTKRGVMLRFSILPASRLLAGINPLTKLSRNQYTEYLH